MNGIIRKKSVKNYGYCGIIRKRDFEDRNPIIAGVLALCGVVVLFILMVII